MIANLATLAYNKGIKNGDIILMNNMSAAYLLSSVVVSFKDEIDEHLEAKNAMKGQVKRWAKKSEQDHDFFVQSMQPLILAGKDKAILDDFNRMVSALKDACNICDSDKQYIGKMLNLLIWLSLVNQDITQRIVKGLAGTTLSNTRISSTLSLFMKSLTNYLSECTNVIDTVELPISEESFCKVVGETLIEGFNFFDGK